MAKSDIVRIGVLGYAGCSAWITAGLLEFFAIANIVADGQGSRLRFDCRTLSPAGGSIQASQRVRLKSDAPRGRYATVIVPPLWSASRAEFHVRIAAMGKLVPWMQTLARKSGIVASACSGGVLLAEAGLLDGHRATICWWLAEWFANRYPDVELETTNLVVADRNRWTAAAGTAYLHLCLELVKELANAEIAAGTGRLALVEPRRGSQSPFLPAHPAPTRDNSLVQHAAQCIERGLSTSLTIAALAHQLGTTERTLNRRFRETFGMSPLGYLQSRRIAHAKRLLQLAPLSFEKIVERCGYSDTASFRKLFAREVGMTPREYRSRFGNE